MLLAQSLDQLLVSGLVAVFSQNAQDGLPLVQGLGSLMKTTMKTVMDRKCSLGYSV